MSPHENEKVFVAQREVWDRYAPGWQRWDDFITAAYQPVTEAMLARLPASQQPSRILDLATGTGEPGLTLARRFPRAQVVGVDASPAMVATASCKAAAAGLGNFRALAIGAGALPFAAEHFDVITCRFGLMFLPALGEALVELRRLLRPGGTLVVSVWAGAERNAWASAALEPLRRYVELPAPPPGAPGLFRCAAPDALRGLLVQAGFQGAEQAALEGVLRFPGPRPYWELLKDVSAPIVEGLRTLDAETQARVYEAVEAALTERMQGGALLLPWAAWIGSGHAGVGS